MFSAIVIWITNWKRTIWWFFLLLIFSYYLVLNYTKVLSSNLTQLDFIIFIIWVILLIFPLFSEIDIAGIKLKKEIESLKSDIKDQMFTLRNEIHNIANFQNIINIPSQPSSDEKLKKEETKYSSLLESSTPTNAIAPSDDTIESIDIPEKNQYLFAVRFALEKELRRILKEHFDTDENKRLFAVSQIARVLANNELLDSRLVGLIREINSICSAAIHGENISSEQYQFVKKFYPQLIRTLKEI